MLLKDVEDYLVQYVMKRLLVPSVEDRATRISDLITNSEQLYLIFERFNKETTIFMETLHSSK